MLFYIRPGNVKYPAKTTTCDLLAENFGPIPL